MPDGLASRQLRRLEDNATAFAMPYIPMTDRRHGIVHVIGPELGFTLPGATLVCGDSHTCTHGALGALAFGIGASECEMVFATQCIRQMRQKRMLVAFSGRLPLGVETKDAVLAFIRAVGVGGSAGHATAWPAHRRATHSRAASLTDNRAAASWRRFSRVRAAALHIRPNLQASKTAGLAIVLGCARVAG
jgi:3-isopropylmalate/(R)-2-methylmalate dehydratase large subunit